jgi:uncharacterized delta-60 repeat protein
MRQALMALGAAFVGATLVPPALGPAHAQTGVQVDWIANYSSGHNPEFAFARAVAVDGSGNVYVTGSSYASNGLPDYATVKYSSSGDMLWVQRYNGPEDNWDAAWDLALDASGNVYVTGVSYGSSFFDYVTIKYSPSGTEEWVARYNDPANSDDWANALAVDGSGNVYVTGYSIGSGTFYDYATVKYGPSGTQEWVARYNGPGNTKDRAWDVAVDGSGNVYVTGDSGEGSINQSDYVTVKYNPSGVEQWAARYTNGYDYATALGVDAFGNVYVTGYSYGSGTFYDYATIRYDANGIQRWVDRYHGGVGDDFAYALAVDAAGNVYVTGESVGSGTGSDYATIKYGPRGRRYWVARYDSPHPGFASDVANAIAVDASGNVYVTGESNDVGTETDFATVKYSASGAEQWVARYNDPANAFDQATALAVDASGNVHVTGSSAYVGGAGRIWTTIKYIQMLDPDDSLGQNRR